MSKKPAAPRSVNHTTSAVSLRSAERFFAGRAASLRLFRAVESYILSLGPVEVLARKTQISFAVKTGFAWVWLPQMWIKQHPQNSIVLTIGLRRRIQDKRIKESYEPYPGRFVHHIVIQKAADLDSKVKAWLRKAYELHRLGSPAEPEQVSPVDS